MSIIEDINKLHVSIKSFLIGLIFIMPFWYLNIYFFAPAFFSSAPFYIPIVISFCISAMCYIPFFLLGDMLFTLAIPAASRDKVSNSSFLTGGSFYSSLISVLTLGIITYIGIIKHLKFFNILNVSMIVIFSEFIIAVFLIGSDTKRKKKDISEK